jgi:hypothetical protein
MNVRSSSTRIAHRLRCSAGALALSLLAHLAAVRPAAAQPAVVKQNVNLRAGPSAGTALKRTLHPGDELTLLHPDTTNRYVEVRTAAGDEGWVYTPRIRVLPEMLPDVYHGCALEGTAQHESRKASNRLKNRGTAPRAAEIASTVTMDELLRPGDDTDRWSADSGAVVEGYVLHVKPGGQETVNCGEKEELYRDTHIELTLSDADTLKARRVVVEVTPRWRDFMRERGEDWTTPALIGRLVGRRVRFTGWLFFDAEHDDEAENTTPGRAANWRATAWELHPVTGIAVVP